MRRVGDFTGGDYFIWTVLSLLILLIGIVPYEMGGVIPAIAWCTPLLLIFYRVPEGNAARRFICLLLFICSVLMASMLETTDWNIRVL